MVWVRRRLYIRLVAHLRIHRHLAHQSEIKETSLYFLRRPLRRVRCVSELAQCGGIIEIGDDLVFEDPFCFSAGVEGQRSRETALKPLARFLGYEYCLSMFGFRLAQTEVSLDALIESNDLEAELLHEFQ